MVKENDSLCLIVMENCKELGEKANKYLKTMRKTKKECLVPINLVRFANGEGKAALQSSVRDKDVFILSDVGNHEVSYNLYGKQTYMTPDEHFQDIKRVISAIRGNAARITVIETLLYQSRQDVRNGRESLDCAIALQELEKMGVHNIVTFDAHAPNVQNAIPLLPFDNFFANNVILNQFIKDEKVDLNKLLVISPDEGAMKRSRYFAAMLGCDIGMFYKRRDYAKIDNGKAPIMEHKYLGKDVEGLDVIIVDDMISSGGSIIDILNELKKKKCRNIYVVTTFAFFTEGVENFDKAYKEGLLTKIYSTNLSNVPKSIREKAWFSLVDCSKFLAEIIETYNKRQSISSLFNGKAEMYAAIHGKKKKTKNED